MFPSTPSSQAKLQLRRPRLRHKNKENRCLSKLPDIIRLAASIPNLLRQPATLIVLIIGLSTALAVAAPQLPARIGDRQFWQTITDFSEPEGISFGGSDNFVSNELE